MSQNLKIFLTIIRTIINLTTRINHMPTIGWFEILIVVGIAIIVLGPKDFPVMLKKLVLGLVLPKGMSIIFKMRSPTSILMKMK